MSDEESLIVPSFLEDVRVKFVGEKVCFLLQLQRKTWEQRAAGGEFQALLQDFFQRQTILYFSSTNKRCVLASNEVLPVAAQSRQIYILKKRPAPIDTENYRRLLNFGLLSSSPLLQLSGAIQQVCGPILTNGKNHPMWPTLISEDISRHVESMCSMTSVVQGQVLGKTVLPIPRTTGWMEKSYNTFKMYENYDRTLAHTIETQVIIWSSLIQKILKQDSSDLLQTGCNPEPDVEIRFWASRKSNLEGIHHQLQSSSVEIMAKVLEVMDSSYLPAINTLIGNVSNALKEAQDVDLYLRPLDAQLSQLKNNGFIDMEKCTPAVFHTLFLIWTNCQYYQRPARIVVLLQELCNLFIEQASAYLPDDLLHREDTEESLLMIKKVVKALRCVRESYQAQKEKLARQKRYPPWDFPSAMAFSRYNQFMNRMLQLENLFETMLEFQMMEKLELGGIRGRFYSEQVAKIHNEFTNHCQALKYSKYNPLDLTSQAFEDDCNTFKRRIADFELRLANLLCLAFKDCAGLESALKMLTIIAPFLERSHIRQLFRPSFILLQQHFKEELENCKFMIKSQLNPVDSSAMKNMAHTSGILKWAKMLKERIETPWEQFRLLFNMSAQHVEMVNVYSTHRDMVSLLDQYEEDIYSDWCNGLEQTCLINLNQTLISRNPTSGLISVNFNPKLAETLKDVKYIHTLSEKTIPTAAITVFDKRDIFTKVK